MAQQEVMYGQISQLMHPPDASKEGGFTSPPVQRPTPFVGFVPFHQQQGLSTPLEPRQPQPSLSLSLEQPDSYRDANVEQYQYPLDGPFRPAPARPFEPRPPDVHPHPSSVRADGVRSFDLEQQPFQHMEQQNRSSYTSNFAETHHGTEIDNAAAPPHIVPAESSEQVDDGIHLQIVSASEYPSNDQSGQHQQYYPLASANHDDVIQDPELFMTTLDNFLAALGTRLTVPKLGGVEMNLHMLYIQVTARGGLEQVIRAARWKELSEVLDVPKPLLNSSFVLRKIYINLLFHYEQVYFFRVEGQLRSPPVPLPSPSAIDETCDVMSPYEAPPEIRASLKKRKRKLDPLQVFGVDPVASVGSMATGAINGKFEEGYLVTVVVGTEKLSGVLYHVSAGNKTQQYASVPSLIDCIGSEATAPGLEIQLYGCKKRKEYIRKINPNAPKRTRTSYNIYFKEQRAKLKELYPELKGLGKKVTEMWNKLSEEEKAPYIARGSQEREQYLAEHREKIRLQESQATEEANDVGVEQNVGEHDDVAYDVSHDYHVSLDVDMDPHDGHPQESEVDQVYRVYPVNEAQTQESELTAGHLVTEHAYEPQDNEQDYPREPVSEEDEEEDDAEDDAELQGAYEEDEDEQVYAGSENAFETQDGIDYQVSDKDYNASEEAYEVHADEASAHDSHGHSGSTPPKQQYFGQDHVYNYASTVSQQQAEVAHGSVGMASFEQTPYQMQDNGQILYPHMQQGRLEALGDNPMSKQHYFTPSKYAFSQARQGQGGEALGLPVSQEPGSFRRLEEGSSFMRPFQQSQAMESNIHARKVPSELAYQERYAYPVQIPYSQMYTRPPHAYAVRFSHPQYPMQVNESVPLQYGHTYAPQLHQPQASVPEVARLGTPPQVYQAQDGGHTLHTQDGNSSPVFKQNAH